MEELKQLDPMVACVLIISISAVVCVFIWQMWKTFRES